MVKKPDLKKWAKKWMKTTPWDMTFYMTPTEIYEYPIVRKVFCKKCLSENFKDEELNPSQICYNCGVDLKDNGMKIVFDLDGVIRNLIDPIEKKYNCTIDTWNWKNPEGQGVMDIVNKNKNILLEAPPTKYAEIVKGMENVEIWTHQPWLWRKRTLKWITNFFGYTPKVRWLSTKQKYKRLLKENCLIVEDCPNFPEYTRILLVHRAYNEHINSKYRIRNKHIFGDYIYDSEK